MIGVGQPRMRQINTRDFRVATRSTPRYAPRLGWRNVELRGALQARLGLPVYVESAPIACALARLWLSPEETRGVHSFAYVSVSDGVGWGS